MSRLTEEAWAAGCELSRGRKKGHKRAKELTDRIMRLNGVVNIRQRRIDDLLREVEMVRADMMEAGQKMDEAEDALVDHLNTLEV